MRGRGEGERKSDEVWRRRGGVSEEGKKEIEVRKKKGSGPGEESEGKKWCKKTRKLRVSEERGR